jgi:hypothetical protein
MVVCREFSLLPQLPQKMTLKSGQNRLKNNHLAVLVYIHTHTVFLLSLRFNLTLLLKSFSISMSHHPFSNSPSQLFRPRRFLSRKSGLVPMFFVRVVQLNRIRFRNDPIRRCTDKGTSRFSRKFRLFR